MFNFILVLDAEWHSRALPAARGAHSTRFFDWPFAALPLSDVPFLSTCFRTAPRPFTSKYSWAAFAAASLLRASSTVNVSARLPRFTRDWFRLTLAADYLYNQRDSLPLVSSMLCAPRRRFVVFDNFLVLPFQPRRTVKFPSLIYPWYSNISPNFP